MGSVNYYDSPDYSRGIARSVILFIHQMTIDQGEGQVLTRLIDPKHRSPAVEEELRKEERQLAGGKVGCSPGTMAGMRARPSVF